MLNDPITVCNGDQGPVTPVDIRNSRALTDVAVEPSITAEIYICPVAPVVLLLYYVFAAGSPPKIGASTCTNEFVVALI